MQQVQQEGVRLSLLVLGLGLKFFNMEVEEIKLQAAEELLG